MPIIEKFLGGMAMGFHHDELKKKRKKPFRPCLKNNVGIF